MSSGTFRLLARQATVKEFGLLEEFKYDDNSSEKIHHRERVLLAVKARRDGWQARYFRLADASFRIEDQPDDRLVKPIVVSGVPYDRAA